MGRKQLKRELNREALSRIEDAARTPEDYHNVVSLWDKLDANRERKERYHEALYTEPLLEWGAARFEGAIIPQPFGHTFWRQILRGDFLDIIFDCPYEIHEMTSSRSVSGLAKELSENQKEILYLRAIKLYTPQRIAALRGQSDRNIRKVYDTLIEGLRKKLFERLAPRYRNGLPLTFAQKEFVECHIANHNKTAALDGGSDS